MVDRIFSGQSAGDLADSLLSICIEVPSTRVCCEVLGRTVVVAAFEVVFFFLVCIKDFFASTNLFLFLILYNTEAGMRSPVFMCWEMHSLG